MRRIRALLLLGLAATLAFAPAAQEDKKFIEDVQKKADVLKKAKTAFDAGYSAIVKGLDEVVENWQRGFDPAVINPKLAAAKSAFTEQQGKGSAALNANPKPDTLKDQAKSKKIGDKPDVKKALLDYEKSHKALQEIVALEIQSGSYSYVEHAGKWKILTLRLADAGKGGNGVKGSETLIVVGSGGLDACRVYGGKATPEGNWWFVGRIPPPADEARVKWALPPTNYCEKYVSIKFKEGAHVMESACADLFGHKATGRQLRFDWKWHQDNEAPAPWHRNGKLKSSKIEDWSDELGGSAVPYVPKK